MICQLDTQGGVGEESASRRRKLLRKLTGKVFALVGVDGLLVVLAILTAVAMCRAVGVPYTSLVSRTLITFESVILKVVLLPAYFVAMYHMFTIGRYYQKGHNYTLRDLRDHWNRSFLKLSNVWAFVRAVILLLFFGTAVSNVKPLVPLYTSKLYDDVLLRLDKAICGGFDLFAWCSSIRGPYLDVIMSAGYHFLFVVFIFSVGILFMQQRNELRLLVLCFMLVYVAGVALHFAVPSLGDVYVAGRAHLYENLPCDLGTRELQRMLWQERMRLLRNPALYFQVAPYTGIAAFPSLHCAHMVSLLLVAWRCHRCALIIYFPMALVLFASTIYFGWHYISDCVVGWILGAAMVYVAAALLRWEEKALARWNSDEAREVPPPVAQESDEPAEALAGAGQQA